MEERLYKLNLAITIADTIVCVVMVLSFGFAAWFFAKWWVNLFSLLPLFIYNSHPILMPTEEGEDDS